MRLIEETEAHILIGLLLLLLLLLSLSLLNSTATSGTTCSAATTTATRWDRGEFCGTFRDQLQHVSSLLVINVSLIAYGVDILALELSKESIETLRVGLNSDG